MSEKIAFAAWDLITLLCFKHHCELKLKSCEGKPFYCCEKTDCDFRVSSYVYSSISNKISRLISSDKLTIGSSFIVKSAGKQYRCKVISASTGKTPKIEVHFVGG